MHFVIFFFFHVCQFNILDTRNKNITLYLVWQVPRNSIQKFKRSYIQDSTKKFDLSLEAKMMGKKAIKSARVFAQETDISDSLSTKEFLVECEPMFQTCFLQMSSCQVTLTNMLHFSKISNIY